MSQSDTESRLTPRQIEALEALMNREPDETLEECGKRAGVSRRTMHRYLRDSTFNAEYRARVALEFAGQRGRMAQALVKGGATPGAGQASMQKIFWTMLGELNCLEISGPDPEPVEVKSEKDKMRVLPLDKLPLPMKIALLEILEAEDREARQQVSPRTGGLIKDTTNN